MKNRLIVISILTSIFIFSFNFGLGQKTEPFNAIVIKSPLASFLKSKTIAPIQTIPHSKTQADLHIDNIPWDELERIWLETIEFYFVQHGVEYESILKLYQQDKIKFQREMMDITKKLNTTYTYNTLKDELQMHDRIKYTFLKKQLEIIKINYKSRVQAIFGNHYAALKKSYSEYLLDIQAYNNNDYEVGIDIAFDGI